jgi:acetate kinase
MTSNIEINKNANMDDININARNAKVQVFANITNEELVV